MENQDKRELILNAAIKVLSKENYENMKTARIASEAGIAEGTIYRYFKSKRDLFVEVMKTVSARLSKNFLEGVNKGNSFKENITSLTRGFLQRKKESDELYKILYKAFSEVEDSGIKEVMETIFQEGVSKIKDFVLWGFREQGQEPEPQRVELAVMMIWGLGDIYWKRDMVSSRKSKIEESELNRVIDVLIGFIQK